MSLNLLDASKEMFSNEIINKASAYLGENESGVSKALSAVVPAIFSGLASKASTAEGANIVAQEAQQQNHSGIIDNISALFTNNNGLMNKASGFVNNLFGNKSDAITSLISGFSGLKNASVSSIFALASPLILSLIGKHAAANNMNAGAVAALLNDQRPHIEAATPAGLTIPQNFNNESSGAYSTHHTEADTAFDEASTIGSSLKWLLVFLLVALIAAACLYFYKGSDGKTEEHTAVTDTTQTTTSSEKTSTTTMVAGNVDSLGNYVYNTGKTITIDLPNNAGKLEVGENSTEAKLVRFLMDKDAVIDTAKGNWYEFTNVRFNTGSSTITDESLVQLKNMVLITKAFPEARFKIGGYTDNTGNETSNVILSNTRAGVVAEKIKSLGAAKESITGSDGYGSKFPIGDNATTEGKAQNRRVSVNVKAK